MCSPFLIRSMRMRWIMNTARIFKERMQLEIEDMNRGGESQVENDKALVPAGDASLSRRSIDVTRTYINRGNSTTRSLWVNIRPRNPILKTIVAMPAAAVMLSMVILMMAIAGFALLATAIMLASRNKPRINPPAN